MRKIITFVLIFVIFLSSAAIAENDSVVGAWYAYLEPSSFPDPDTLGDYSRAVIIFVFTEDGTIQRLELDYAASNVEFTDSGIIGKWEKSDNVYYTSVVGVGKEKIIFEDGVLYASLFNNKTFFGLRKMEVFDAYYNVLIK